MSNKLLLFLLDNNVKPLFLDVNLTEQSVKMIEKLIKNNLVNPKIADLGTGLLTTYDQEKHENIGIDRDILNKDEAKNKVWVLESYKTKRTGLLSQYVEYL